MKPLDATNSSIHGANDISLVVPTALTAGCSMLRTKSVAAVTKPTLRPSIRRPLRRYSDARFSPQRVATARIPIKISNASQNFATAIPIVVCVVNPKSLSPRSEKKNPSERLRTAVK